MWTPWEKAQCVAWFIETKFHTQVYRKFLTLWKGTTVPTNYLAWYTSFMETGSVFHKQGRVAHLFQTQTLHLGIGLCLYEPGYTQSILLCYPHFSSNLRDLEDRKSLLLILSQVENRLFLSSTVR
ncbi:hypothetical protein AVEN_184971-1 [Araneus ventricosus]|uniref:Uncharacterized protein n=1 Tax=Araneus ventricosus TaxID=182803 RepID=A0A4Y2Q843_ARAVE|nr:hypothetical protein AVEN_184971-1 [Araneus ventricosus]